MTCTLALNTQTRRPLPKSQFSDPYPASFKAKLNSTLSENKAAQRTLAAEAEHYRQANVNSLPLNFAIERGRWLAAKDRANDRAEARKQGGVHHHEERLPLRYQLGAGLDRVSDACTRLTNTLNRGISSVVRPVADFLGKTGNAFRLPA